MAKKRQQDFTKTQLKPGRNLPRRKNVAPSFKSKKIEMPGKKTISSKPMSNILDCLKATIKTGCTAPRITAVRHLENLVRNKESLSPYVREVLEVVVAKLLLETDLGLRSGALNVVKAVLKQAEDETFKVKISSHGPLFINVLSACMTHPNSEVRKSSLDFLEIILMYHPDLVCNSLVVLQNFQKLITDSPRKFSHPQFSKSRSSLPVISSNSDNSADYRIYVLKIMKQFLKEMLKNFEAETNVEADCDEQEVYWDSEGPLHLQLYAGSGLKPVDIEKSLSNNTATPELSFNNLPLEHDFINGLITLIRGIFFEEIAGQTRGDDNELHLETVKHLNVLLHVICQLTELESYIPCSDVESTVEGFLLADIYEKNLFPFKARKALSNDLPNEVAELNLAVCFLHSKFLLKSESDKFGDSIINYTMRLFTVKSVDKYRLINILVKILKRYYCLAELRKKKRVENLGCDLDLNKYVSDFVTKSLLFLSNLLNNADDHHRNILMSLFLKLSLYPAYNFLIEKNAMENWFKWLLAELKNIPRSGKVNRKLLHIIKRIANRKYPYFLQALTEISDHQFITLLKYDNADVRDTVIFLIYNMRDINGSLLEDISNVILLDSSIPFRFTVRLIRQLTCRFAEKLPTDDTDMDICAFRRGRTDFIQFLLNLAIDSLSLTSEKWFDYDENDYSKAMEPFKDVTAYNIFPSLHWKEHSKLFEVCQKSLSLLPRKLVNNVMMLMFTEILENTRNLPMHCVLAILKLNNSEIKDGHYRFLIDDLVFSSLLTTSVLTHMPAEDEWYENNVIVLMESIKLSRKLAIETLQRQLDCITEIDGISLFYILRIFKFYLDRSLFQSKDRAAGLEILTGFKEKCTDKTFKHQPLFSYLYNVLYLCII